MVKYSKRKKQLSAIFAQRRMTEKALLEFHELEHLNMLDFIEYINSQKEIESHEYYETSKHNECYMSYTEIGDKLNISGTRVRQIINKALRKLRHPLRSQELRSFIEN